ncbi:polyadenylate-binding protein RBP47C-like [Chenopodium quinoa]|uniref:polyadenylate-binding protein RBP47C-like n=1 Tax=Chenopodium quinoa TaxID=63459 RepID=UPI000B78EE95|nr:polyadenylate-binding protein RBP47C-like [Chenopodium quinoa]
MQQSSVNNNTGGGGGAGGGNGGNSSSDQNNNSGTNPQSGAVATPPPAGAVWMQYPAAAMVMQHQMMAAPQHYPPPPHYMAAYHPHHAAYMQPPPPPHHHHHHQRNNHHNNNNNNSNNNSHSNTGNNNSNSNGSNNNNNNNDGSSGENKTIWVGDLHHWMDEIYLSSCFASAGEIASVKVIRNKQTGASEGYGFVEFFTHAIADKVLQSYTGHMMPNAEQPFRLNWATFSMADKRTDNGSDLSIFVGDLAADVTDTMLHELFATKYPSVKAAKVVIDANTGRSKGYGFVRFGDDSERTQAMTDMNGVYCSTRPMRIGPATPRKSLGYQQGGYGSSNNAGQGSQSEGDSSNTTIFVGGLDPSVTDEDLRQPFSQYGEIVSVKIPVGKGCGFVQFANRGHAEEALNKLNGSVIGKQTVRLSWGRNPANKQSRGDYGNQWNGGYYGGHIYDGGYGYLPHPHDPSMYAAAAAAYGAYPVYGNQQQVS